MEVIGAVSSFIAIAQGIELLGKLIKVVDSMSYASAHLTELVFELETLVALQGDVEMCLELLSLEKNEEGLEQTEPVYIQRIRFEITSLVEKLQSMTAEYGGSAGSQHMPKTMRVKWVWKRERIATRLRDRARRLQGYLQSAMNLIAFRHSITQKSLLVDIHTATVKAKTTSIEWPEDLKIDPKLGRRGSASSQGSQESQESCPPAYDLLRRNELEHRWQPNFSAPVCVCGLALEYEAQFKQADPGSAKALSQPPFLCRNCTSKTHPGRRIFSRQYNLPRWVAKRTIAFAISYDAIHGVGVSLHMPVIIENNSFWTALERRDEKGLLDWIIQNRYTPMDGDGCGFTLMQTAIRFHQWESLLYFLRNCGFMLPNSDTIRAAANYSRHLMYVNDRMPDREVFIHNWIISLSGKDLEPASWPIHKAIRGQGDLVAAIKSQPYTIDQLDDTGEAPIHIACSLKNDEAVKTLLQYGASVHVKNDLGDQPLHRAAAHRLDKIGYACLDAGADITVRGYRNEPPLIRVVNQPATKTSFEMCRRFIRAGASVFDRDGQDWTPLHQLSGSDADCDHEALEGCFNDLMAAGAMGTLNARNSQGDPPLFLALFQENYVTARLLLEAGCRTDMANDKGRNILHLAAMHAKIPVLEVLLDHGLPGLDIRTPSWTEPQRTALGELRRCIHTDNKTFQEFERVPTPDEVEFFEILLREIRDRAITAECVLIEETISDIKQGLLKVARENLRCMMTKKNEARITWEAETFRAIGLQVRQGLLDMAVESLEEYMEVSRARMKLSPFQEEVNPYVVVDEDDGESDCGCEGDCEDKKKSKEQEKDTQEMGRPEKNSQETDEGVKVSTHKTSDQGSSKEKDAKQEDPSMVQEKKGCALEVTYRKDEKPIVVGSTPLIVTT